MSRWAFLLFVLIPAGSALGQSAFDSERVGYGGFIGPVLKVSTVNEDAAQLLGLRGGVIFNLEKRHTINIGAGAYGVFNDINARDVTLDGDDVHLGFDYAGLELAYLHRTFRVVHFSVQTLIGAGGIAYRDVGDGESGDGFFVMEPGAAVTFHVLKFVRLQGSVSYRYINGVNLLGTSNEDLSSASLNVALQFGRF